MRIAVLSAAFLTTASLLAAQPSFDLVSIRPNSTAVAGTFHNTLPSVRLTENRYTEQRTTLQDLIMQAYNVWDYQISGLPDWAKSPTAQSYDIDARVAGPKMPTRKEAQLMVQALLEQRFHLQLHRETKELPIYALTVADGGAKLQKVPGAPTTMQLLAIELSQITDKPVIDKTDLTGTYDISGLNWQPILKEHRADPASLPASLPQALEDHTGLKLEPRTELIEMLVIDQAEKPSTNN